MIQAIPLVKKYKRVLNALQVILRRHVDNMVDLCRNQYNARPIDINTKFVVNSGPRPDDTKKYEYNAHYDLFG